MFDFMVLRIILNNRLMTKEVKKKALRLLLKEKHYFSQENVTGSVEANKTAICLLILSKETD